METDAREEKEAERVGWNTNLIQLPWRAFEIRILHFLCPPQSLSPTSLTFSSIFLGGETILIRSVCTSF